MFAYKKNSSDDPLARGHQPCLPACLWFVCLSVSLLLSVFHYFSPSIHCLSLVCLLSISMSVCLFVCLLVCLSVSLSNVLSFFSVSRSVSLSVWLSASVCVSVYLFLSLTLFRPGSLVP